MHTARLLAIYEGDKDNYECMQKVFGPVIEETMKVLSNITELDLKVDLTKNPMSPSQQPNFDIRGMGKWPHELQELFRNCQNEYRSQRCLLCQKQHISNHIPPTVMPTTHPVQSIPFQSSGSVLEGIGSS